MIQSEHKTFGFWFGIAAIAASIFFIICCMTQYYYNFRILNMDIPNQKAFYGFIILFLFNLLFWGTVLSLRASSITIHCEYPNSKAISFKNLFTRQSKTYLFDEFNGYIATRLWHKQFNQNKTLCLIKDGKVFKKIDNFFYSNVDDLEKGFDDLKYLGFINMGIVNSWKVLCNKPIIKQ